MSKIIVSKEIDKELVRLKEVHPKLNEFGVVKRIMTQGMLSASESLIAVRAYLNEDGYEVEKTSRELAIEMHERVLKIKSDNKIADTFREIGFSEGMEWMDENFNLGLNLKDK